MKFRTKKETIRTDLITRLYDKNGAAVATATRATYCCATRPRGYGMVSTSN